MSDQEWKRMGMRIRDVRLQRGVTQQDLSCVAGVSSGHISNIERGARGVKLETIVSIVNALDVSLDYIIRGIRPQMGAWGLVFRSDDELEIEIARLD